MHQSGHSRAHSMQTVQFSSNRAITPRLRGGRSAGADGYCRVIDRRVIVRNVTASPLARPPPGSRVTKHHDSLQGRPWERMRPLRPSCMYEHRAEPRLPSIYGLVGPTTAWTPAAPIGLATTTTDADASPASS